MDSFKLLTVSCAHSKISAISTFGLIHYFQGYFEKEEELIGLIQDI